MDMAVGAVQVREADLMQVVPFTTQRDARWFDAPASFRPARFLGEPTWPRYAYVPFGAGPRVCIGQAFGLLEAVLILATLLQRFSPTPATEPVVPEPRFSLHPRGGLIQRWEPASANG